MSHNNVCITYDNVSCTCEGRTHIKYSHQGFMKNGVRTQNNNFWRSMFKKQASLKITCVIAKDFSGSLE